ncbi:MAG: hypothetical protein J1E37_00760 [Prevotella sp.]|nr:hypothetical protein [Prevotella sp.]
MQNFTYDDSPTDYDCVDLPFLEPNAATLLFVKQFARMCNSKKNQTLNGYNHCSIIACC